MRTTDNVTLDELSVIHPEHLVYHGYASPLIQFLQIGGAFLHRLELRSCYGATLTGYQLAILRLCTQLTWLGLFPRDRIYSRYEMFAHITDIMSYLSDASLPRTLTDLVLHVNVYSASNSDNYAPEVAHCAELDQRLCALAAERGVKVVCKVIVPPRPSYARNGYVGAAESGLFVQANVHGLVQFIDGEEY
ncbi:hypothetical protein EUX98_g8792 [Antrodiella citrinella]|uniref:Uncharacterized protein n=1 Tax=Antrodiella citrinella TaxID=2447956 RepID=A0A4S4M2P9_9APHY|nr:hypothetical protein EUX98_g8792 [Antrodiella citrinella]